MPIYTKLILLYLAFISLVAVILTIKDKSAAKKGKWRVPEATLMLVGLAGGALAMYITMKTIRHKTKHMKFMIGLPAEFLLHIAIICLIMFEKFNLF